MTGFPLDDQLRHFLEVLVELELGNLLEIGILGANLIGIAKHRPEQPLVPGLEHDDALSPGHHHAAKPDDALFSHGIADDREGFLAHLFVGAM